MTLEVLCAIKYSWALFNICLCQDYIYGNGMNTQLENLDGKTAGQKRLTGGNIMQFMGKKYKWTDPTNDKGSRLIIQGNQVKK